MFPLQSLGAKMPVSIANQEKKAKIKEGKKKKEELIVLFPVEQNCIQEKKKKM